VVCVFARETSEPLTSLVKQIDAKIGENGKLKSFVVITPKGDEKPADALKAMASKAGIKHVPLTIGEGPDGPPDYEIARGADVTVAFAYLTGNTSLSEPHQAGKGQQFRVTVTVPYKSIEAAAGAAEGLQDFNGLDSARMGITLLISVIGFTLLGSAWILMRIRLQNLIDYADGLKMRVAARLSARPRPAVVSGLALVLSQVGEPNQFNAYLIGGYTVMSAFCLLYMGYLAMRQRNLQGDIALLTQLLQEGDRPRR